jgi:methanogenic corrinoid protein MtbC1
MDAQITPLGADGLKRFRMLRAEAVHAVTDRFYALHGPTYEQFGARGREACGEDLAFHLDFLEPAIEFGLARPMVDYLHWLASVLAARSVPGDHVATSLDLLGEFFMERMNSEEGAIVSSALIAVRTEFMNGATPPPAPPAASDEWPEACRFEAALLAGHQHAACEIVQDCFAGGRSLVNVERYVIQPALYRIGERWRANQITVAREHMATAIAQSVMTVGLLQSPPPAAIGKRIVLACVAGNQHAIGVRMVADAFQFSGWDVEYLGADVPIAAIVHHSAECKPDIIGLSVAFPQQLRIVKEILTRLNGRFGATRPPVIIGGYAINCFEHLAEMVGADAWSPDAPSAVARASELVFP